MPEASRTYATADFAAKVRWRMRFDRNPLLTQLQDKLAVREYAAARGVACPRVLGAFNDPRSIPFDRLPGDYMLKANHGSQWNIIAVGSQHYAFGDGSAYAAGHPEPLTRTQVVDICQQWLRTRFSSAEWAYRHIPPRLLIEEILHPRQGTELMDYRFYTFEGQVKAINVGCSRFRRDHLNVFLDREWNPFELTRYAEALPADLPHRPSTLPEMRAVAETLGRGVDFARIDLYDTSIGVVLGEMTVYPQGGLRLTPTGCPVFNQWLGDQWRMGPGRELAVRAYTLAADLRARTRELRSRDLQLR